jgi:hypothetical protein
MRQETVNHLVAEHTKHLAKGLKPEHIKFATAIKPLRNATVGATVRCFEWLTSDAGKRIVRRAWANCTFEGAYFNLSAEYLTSNLAMSHLLSYLKTHRTLFDEISATVGDIWGIEDMPDDSDDVEDLSYGGAEFDDDTDVPMQSVVRACLDLNILDAPNPAAEFCVGVEGVAADADGDLVSTSPDEHVLDLDEAVEEDEESELDSDDNDG